MAKSANILIRSAKQSQLVVVEDRFPGDFEEKVNNLLLDGWRITSTSSGRGGKFGWFQAILVKDE